MDRYVLKKFLICLVLVISCFTLIPNRVLAKNSDYESSEELENVTDTCSDYALAQILHTVQLGMNLIKIIAPIGAILSLTVIMFLSVISMDEKKIQENKKKLMNVVISLVVIFLLQFIVEFTMRLAGNNFEFTTCWNQADKIYDQISN